MSLNLVFSKALCCVLKIYVKKPKFRKEFLEKSLFHIIIILYEIYVIILNVTNNNYVSIIFSIRGRKPEREERIGGRERKGDRMGEKERLLVKHCSPWSLHQFTFSPAVYEGSFFSMLSPTFVVFGSSKN